MLRAVDLACARSQRIVLAGVTLELRPGELLGVLGANGAGKSSLLSTLAGELPAARGRLDLDGRALAHWSAPALARRRAVLPQAPSLSFDLDVEAIVGMGAYPFEPLAPVQREAVVSRALALADADALRQRRYLALSGGEQQRVQLARVLAQLLSAKAGGEYRALLLDEPTANLDPRHQHRLLGAVAALARDEGIAVAVVLHDVNLAARWCDRVLLVAEQQPIALGVPGDVISEDHLRHVYGVAARVIEHPLRRGQPLVVFDVDDDDRGAGGTSSC